MLSNQHIFILQLHRFLDTYTFASGSDDTTIKIWDLRFLKEAVRTLQGHSNWVT